ncbi:MAG: hypothetical protein ISR65_17590 [Bacteriovoracaceae bacterium]|nr:hypothetical protein [Bacteriovoracaceae bacterium]
MNHKASIILLTTSLVLCVIGYEFYLESNNIDDLASPQEKLEIKKVKINKLRYKIEKKETLSQSNVRNNSFAERNDRNLAVLNMKEIDEKIQEIDERIVAKDFIARANNEALSSSEIKSLKNLLIKRNDLFKAKAKKMLLEL